MPYDRTPIAPEALERFLATNREWVHEQHTLVRTYEFGSFPEAIRFVGRVAELAETQDHHPDIDIRFRRVSLRLTTHAAGNRLTQHDLDLAQGCEALR